MYMQVHFGGHTFTIVSVSFPIPKGHIGGRFPALAGMMVSHEIDLQHNGSV